MVKHSSRFLFAVLAAALAAFPGGALHAANPHGDMPLYVAAVQVGGIYDFTGGPSGNIHSFAAAAVLIVDQHGQPVGGVRVVGKFSDCDENYTASATTNNDVFSTGEGWAIIKGRRWECDCGFKTFTVTAVTKNGWSWDPPNPRPSATICCGDCN